MGTGKVPQKAVEERARAETEYLKKHPDYTVISYTQIEGGLNSSKEEYESGYRKMKDEEKELSKGFTGIEINGVKFSNVREMLIYMNKQRDNIAELEKQIEKMKCCANCSKWLDCKSEIPTEVCKDWKMEEEK